MSAATTSRPAPRRTPSIRPARVALYVAMCLIAVFFIFPIYLLVITAFKSFDQVSLSRMWDLPNGISLGSFDRAWNGGEGSIGMRGSFLNSVLMVVPATVISCLLGSLNGYVVAKWRFRGSETLFTMILFGMFIPYQSILVPLVQVLRTMHLYGSLGGLVLTHVVYGIPITTLIFRNYYVGVPT